MVTMSTNESSIICERILDTVQESSEVTTRDSDAAAKQSFISMSESSTIIHSSISDTAKESSEITTRASDTAPNQSSISMNESSTIIHSSISDTAKESSEVTTRASDAAANQSINMSESSTIISESISDTAEVSSEVITRDNNDVTTNQLSMSMSESPMVICKSIHIIQESPKVTNVTTHGNSNKSVNQLSSQTQAEKNKESSLDVIAQQYKDFSDEEETDKEAEDQDAPITKEQTLQQYRTNVIEELSSEISSSEESDSEEDSSSNSSSSSTDDSDDYNDSTTKNVNKNDAVHNKQEKSKTKARQEEIENELNMLPPIEDLRISVPEDTCMHLGQVAWIVEQLVVVKPRLDAPTLDLDTVLFLEKGQKVLGKIYDVFGSVKETHYCVRFNSSTHIEENGIKVNMPVYLCSDTSYTFIIFWHELIKIKGWDTDDLNGEPPDFSDDEKEQAYYAKMRQKKKAKDNTKNSVGNNNTQESLQRAPMCNERPSFRRSFIPPQVRNANPTRSRVTSRWQSNHPWSKNGQNKKSTSWRNREQNETYAHWPQTPMDQSNMYQPQYNPGNSHFTYNKTQRYCAPFNARQDHAYQFPNYPFDAYSSIPPTFNSVSQYSNNIQYSNAPFSQMSYPMQPYLSHIPTYSNTSWPSMSLSQLPPPPPSSPLPPSVLSIPAPPPSDRTNEYN